MSPSLSIVVACYDMDRELPRTLHSLSRAHQRDVDDVDYEVVVVDNGSPSPVEAGMVESFGEQYSLRRVHDAPPSPVAGINAAAGDTDGELLAVIIDGARMVTPGVVRGIVDAASIHPEPVIGVLAFHLGPDRQPVSTTAGYDQEVEDGLLAGIGWPADGYRLFEIAVLGGSSRWGWFGHMAESSCVAMRRSTFEALGGYDERFRSPGGGLASADLWRRAAELPGSRVVTQLGEGSFHQVHGGAVSGGAGPVRARSFADLEEEYAQLRGERFERPTGPISALGTVTPPALPFLELSARLAAEASA